MSIWNTLKADTAGVFVRAWTGTMDPWTLANIKQQTAADLTKAAGPNGDPAALAANIASTNALLDTTLATMPGGSALPGSCDFRLPIIGCIAGPDSGQGLANLNLLVDVLLGAVVLGVGYVIFKEFGFWGDLRKIFK